jgi:hypothetical protein
MPAKIKAFAESALTDPIEVHPGLYLYIQGYTCTSRAIPVHPGLYLYSGGAITVGMIANPCSPPTAWILPHLMLSFQVNVGRAGAANLDVIQEVEYVKEEAKLGYLLECLQKTAPPVLVFGEPAGNVSSIYDWIDKLPWLPLDLIFIGS